MNLTPCCSPFLPIRASKHAKNTHIKNIFYFLFYFDLFKSLKSSRDILFYTPTEFHKKRYKHTHTYANTKFIGLLRNYIYSTQLCINQPMIWLFCYVILVLCLLFFSKTTFHIFQTFYFLFFAFRSLQSFMQYHNCYLWPHNGLRKLWTATKFRNFQRWSFQIVKKSFFSKS